MQREIERLEHPDLGVRTQVDEQIAAGHHVQAREWRVGQHVMDGENDGSTQIRGRSPAGILPHEEPRQSGRC